MDNLKEIFSQIKTEQRRDDWIAWIGTKATWEAGKTESEAVGRLVLRIAREA